MNEWQTGLENWRWYQQRRHEFVLWCFAEKAPGIWLPAGACDGLGASQHYGCALQNDIQLLTQVAGGAGSCYPLHYLPRYPVREMINVTDEIKKIEKICGEMSPFLKAVLACDGSLSALLDAVFGRTSVKIKAHETKKAEENENTAKLLGIACGQDFILRSVLICASETPLAFALSYAACDGLSADFKKDLEFGGLGIGRLIVKYNMETRREIVKINLESQSKAFNEIFGNTQLLNREYKIIGGGKTLFYIKEVFPLNAFNFLRGGV